MRRQFLIYGEPPVALAPEATGPSSAPISATGRALPIAELRRLVEAAVRLAPRTGPPRP